MTETIPSESPAPAALGTDRPAPASGPPIGRATAAALLVVLAVLGASYAPNLRELNRTWSSDPNYSHGYLVFPVALLILWTRRTHAVGLRLAPWRWGWLALAATLLARAYFYEAGDEWRESATILPVLACLVLTFGGWPLLRMAWPALAFLIFLLPLPPRFNNFLSQPLQQLATAGSVSLAKLTGLWVMSEGNIILVGSDQLGVAAACNGLSMLMSLSATVAAMVALLPMSIWKRVVLLLCIIPTALISNVVRITATAWCYHLFGSRIGGKFAHDAAGWMMMPLALVLVGLELALLSYLVVEEKPTTPATARAATRPIS